MSERISPQELKQRIEDGDPIVIDVRSPERFAAGHIAGARNIPLALIKEQVPAFPKDRPIITHCEG